MAVKTFDEIYSGLSAQEKALLDNVIAREPELKGGWLRQDDYSRKQTELKKRETDLQEAVDYKIRMEPWAEDAYARLHRLEEAGVLDGEGNELWTAQKEKLESDIKAAREAGLGGADMKPEEIDARVKAIVKDAGVLTKDEITALYRSEATKIVDDGFKAREAEFNAKTIPFVAGFGAGVAVVATRYERESGQPFDAAKQAELFKIMNDKQVFDPYAVQEDFLAPIKAKKAEEDRIEAEVQRRLGERGMPGGGGEEYIPQPGQGKGALQAALDRSTESAGDFEAMIKGKAVAAAKALQSEGKF